VTYYSVCLHCFAVNCRSFMAPQHVHMHIGGVPKVTPGIIHSKSCRSKLQHSKYATIISVPTIRLECSVFLHIQNKGSGLYKKKKTNDGITATRFYTVDKNSFRINSQIIMSNNVHSRYDTPTLFAHHKSCSIGYG